MNSQFSRTRGLFNDENYEKLKSKKIIIFGVGGVGSSALEALVRFGFEEITIVDNDRVDVTNLNRQIYSTRNNIGMFKCLAVKERALAINPNVKIKYYIKKLIDNLEDFNLKSYDYVIDAIDTVSAKINLIEYCHLNNIQIISSMGTGNRIDSSQLRIMDVFETKNDPLSKIIRHELKARGIKKQKVVSSLEIPYTKSKRLEGARRSTPFSVSYVPPVSGYLMVAEVIKYLLEKENE